MCRERERERACGDFTPLFGGDSLISRQGDFNGTTRPPGWEAAEGSLTGILTWCHNCGHYKTIRLDIVDPSPPMPPVLSGFIKEKIN